MMFATSSATSIVQIFTSEAPNGHSTIESSCNTWNDGWLESIQFCRWRMNACWILLAFIRVVGPVGTFGTLWSLSQEIVQSKVGWIEPYNPLEPSPPSFG